MSKKIKQTLNQGNDYSAAEGNFANAIGVSIDGKGEDKITCKEVQAHLLQTSHPEEVVPASYQKHLDSCQACQTFRSQLVLIDDLTREQAPELPDGFQLSLYRRLKESAANHKSPEIALSAPTSTSKEIGDSFSSSHELRHSRRWLRTSFAAAALVLIVGGALFFASRWIKTDERKLTYHQLRLAIQSNREYPEVFFDVDLPSGVRPLPATGKMLGQENLKWQSPLHQGMNEFDLPLVASRMQGKVNVRLQVGQESWTGTIILEGNASQTSQTEKRGQHLQLALILDDKITESRGGRR